MSVDKAQVLEEIKDFLEGYNDELKYLVNVETDPSTNYANCVIQEPDKEPVIKKIYYEPFMYMKDLEKAGLKLYNGIDEDYVNRKKIKYGITITKLRTGNQYRLEEGYMYKITSKISSNAILNFLNDGGVNPYAKLKDVNGDFVRGSDGKYVYPYRDSFFSVRPTEQFFISTRARLYKGYEEYNNIHKLTFDIETTGLRPEVSRVFAIGVRDNRGFETILEVDEIENDEAEVRLIQDFFNTIHYIKPAIIAGYNSEEFDFDYLLGRAKILKMDLTKLPTSFKGKDIPMNRRGNVSVKYGNTAEKYTATEMWGYSIIDILHASKRTAAINSDIEKTGLKYIAKFEKIAKPTRTYIKGEDNDIGKFYYQNKYFIVNENNEYAQIPEEYQELGGKLYKLQKNKSRVTDDEYKALKKTYLDDSKGFVDWYKRVGLPKKMDKFITGKKLVKQYLLDDLWETEQVDNLYNQSSFLLAKIVPTTYQRVCTMGTAGIWNLLMTAWSYENDLAIPFSEPKDDFSGGLARCYKTGYSKKLAKIDFASLYPMEQLTWDIFPMFDITGVIKKMLLYLTTTRNIYKKIASDKNLLDEEVTLLRQLDHEMHERFINQELTKKDKSSSKVKQLPIKILNNSLFGALGSGIAFNWSDNICAARITCTGRINLRKVIKWFRKFGCYALLAVTDGVNFQIPEKTNIRVSPDGKITTESEEQDIEWMWQYGGENGINALIELFNAEEMPPPFMSVDNDGEYEACLNLSRINYATLKIEKDKETGEVKEKVNKTGNTIKSKVMSDYIQEFFDKGLKLILEGKGVEFVEYYNSYVEDIWYYQIPLKKIATKSRVKTTLKGYKNRGKDKNGREKGMQAHMELLLQEREKRALELFEEHKGNLDLTKPEEKYDVDEKMKLIAHYMPPEPELDSTVYHVNTGYRKSHGSSSEVTDEETGNKRLACTLINTEDLINNPDMKGTYNRERYLDAFNKRISTILVGFDPEVAKKILAKIKKKKEKGKSATYELELHKEFTREELQLRNFDSDDFEESMYLETKEVRFWNDYGYDPRKIWDGFEMKEDDRVHYGIYEHALNYLNDLMSKSNKPRIKAIDDDYKAGDLVLIKNKNKYHVGAYNGIYLKIVKEDVQIPKSEIEIELDKQRETREKKIQELKITLEKTEQEKIEEIQRVKRVKFFHPFKEKFPAIGHYVTMEDLFEDIPEAKGALDAFITECETDNEKLAEINNIEEDPLE